MKVRFPAGKETVVLRLLRDDPRGLYGLQLVERSEGALSRGGIYVTLDRMIGKGFVKASVPRQTGGHPGMPRPVYRITPLGQRALEAAEIMGFATAGSRA